MRIINAIYAIQKRAWHIFRPQTRGVKVMVLNASGCVLLIRNSYGRSDLFVLPGGGIRPFEQPAVAAAREIREELGLEITDLVYRSRHSSVAEGKRDEIHLFEARTLGEPQVNRFELEEARFFAVDQLPTETSPATRRRLDEYLGRRQPDGNW